MAKYKKGDRVKIIRPLLPPMRHLSRLGKEGIIHGVLNELFDTLSNYPIWTCKYMIYFEGEGNVGWYGDEHLQAVETQSIHTLIPTPKGRKLLII